MPVSRMAPHGHAGYRAPNGMHLQSSMAAEAAAYSFRSRSHAQWRLKPFSQLRMQTGWRHMPGTSLSGSLQVRGSMPQALSFLCLTRALLACYHLQSSKFYACSWALPRAKWRPLGCLRQFVKHSGGETHLWFMDRVSWRFSTV